MGTYVRLGDDVVTITPTVDPTTAYAAADVLFNPVEVENAVQENGRSVVQSIVVIDTDDQQQAFDLVFFDSNVSLGTVNAGSTLSDNGAGTGIGHVSITASDYCDLGNSAEATKRNVGLEIKPADGETSVWVGAISRGTPTYASGSLKIRIGLLRA